MTSAESQLSSLMMRRLSSKFCSCLLLVFTMSRFEKRLEVER